MSGKFFMIEDKWCHIRVEVLDDGNNFDVYMDGIRLKDRLDFIEPKEVFG